MRFGGETVKDRSLETISKGSLGLWSSWFLSEHFVPRLHLKLPGSICESRLYDTTCFLLGVSSLFLLVDLFTTSLGAAFLVLGSVYVDQGSKIRFIGSWISFLDCLFSPG